LPRIQTDLFELFRALHDGELSTVQLEIDSRTAATVMLVAGGYPGDYEKGHIISGLEKADDIYTFHAGTTFNADNDVLTNGGRVLALTALGNTLDEALAQVNAAAQDIKWTGRNYRSDIGFDLK